MLKSFLIVVCVVGLWTRLATAQSAVTLSITNSPGYAVPADFIGLSFGTQTSAQIFSATNIQLINLFQQIGIKNLRVMGDEQNKHTTNLLGFVQMEGSLSLIYGVTLTNLSQATNTAAVIWTNGFGLLKCFEIGNEPDWTSANNGTTEGPGITNYTSFLAVWRSNAAAMLSVAPGAVFEGMDTGGNYDNGPPDKSNGAWENNGTEWTTNFAYNEKSSGIVKLITQHTYMADMLPGGVIITNAPTLIAAMLSPGWDNVTNQILYNGMGKPVLADGLPYRFTEANEITGGITNASNAFAAALWALDFMHWWAAHGISGINFHNQAWIPTDTLYLDSKGNFRVNPKAYGIKAFDVGTHGSVEPMGMVNSAGLNLTAYAVGDETNLYVTLINREYGAGARDASVTMALIGFSTGSVNAMYLTSANGIGATNGVTLGGGTITNNAPWLGQWTALGSVTNNQCTVTVPATSAAIVKIAAAPEILSVQGAGQINWSYGMLQSATNVAGPYNDVSNISSPYAMPMTNGQQFYRVREN